jgi:murein DD-endopeptidase MepM/ murein hydrolase activator NlpD
MAERSNVLVFPEGGNNGSNGIDPTLLFALNNGGGFGNHVIIRHKDKQLITIYGHMSKITTRKGATVNAGDKIGEVGSTGHSTGYHLHFEIRVNGSPTDPTQYLY